MRIVVVLPAPLEPRNPNTWARGTSSSSPDSAVIGPKRFTSPLMARDISPEDMPGPQLGPLLDGPASIGGIHAIAAASRWRHRRRATVRAMPKDKARDSLRERLIVRPGASVDIAKLDAGETFGHAKDTAPGKIAADVERLAGLQERLWAE